MPITDATVNVEVRTTYGVDRIYPLGRNATLFARLLGKRTFNEDDLNIIKGLGYEVYEVPTTTLPR